MTRFAPFRPLPLGPINGELGWVSALGTRGVHRPLSDPSTDLQVRCHGSGRDGRDVPKAELGRCERLIPGHSYSVSDKLGIIKSSGRTQYTTATTTEHHGHVADDPLRAVTDQFGSKIAGLQRD